MTNVIVGRNDSDDLEEVRVSNGGIVTTDDTIYRLSSETKPTVDENGKPIRNGRPLIEVDTKAAYLFYKGTWYAQ